MVKKIKIKKPSTLSSSSCRINTHTDYIVPPQLSILITWLLNLT